jgi:hypothetical protein
MGQRPLRTGRLSGVGWALPPSLEFPPQALVPPALTYRSLLLHGRPPLQFRVAFQGLGDADLCPPRALLWAGMWQPFRRLEAEPLRPGPTPRHWPVSLLDAAGS